MPLTIPAYPCNNTATGALLICVNDNQHCCTKVEFQAPDCCNALTPCEITNLTVETGDCTSDSTYGAWVNFQVTNPPGGQFSVWTNGEFYGTFPLDSLPLHIANFPWNGGANDVVKICFVLPNGDLGCCKTKEFPVPPCLNQTCEIYDLSVLTGDCTGDSTYVVKINFQVANPDGNTFGVWANGEFVGAFNLSQLPLVITNFPWDGGPYDVVKVCFIDPDHPDLPPTCCRTKEFPVPGCLNQGGACDIYDLVVDTGDCTGDSSYVVTINFQVTNPPANTFGLWANGVFFGSYNLSQLPLTITNFPWNGGPNDVIKVCLAPNTNTGCCETKEFPVPGCLNQGGPCEVFDLVVTTGDCTGDSSYVVTIDFQVANPPGNVFGVWANGEFLGTFNVGQLPLTITNFPWNGGPNDVVKVCFLTPNGAYGCCRTKEFDVPDCLNQGGPCEIFNLTVETGDCTGDSTYHVLIDFQVANPPGNTFGVWANGEFLGTFNLNQLPLAINDFPWNGGPNDVVKVCFVDPDHPDLPPTCCRIKEFPVPDCLNQGGPCEIHDLTVETGDCTGDSSYVVTIDFQVTNPPGNAFAVWANGTFFGIYNLNQLPLTITNFPWNGGPNDVVKICFGNGGTVSCCETKEFAVPDCLGQDNCHIYDLLAIPTPCLCGQFFVAITFQHQNGGAGGFEIVGNGNNYGSFPYNTQQPIILGPLQGDGTTQYEFAVHDVQHPDCGDAVAIGAINCMTPVVDPGSSSKLVLSPNPTSNWLNVTAQLQGNAKIGEATVDIYHADGRLLRSVTVPDGSNFQLDVADLPAGVYRLALQTAAGRLDGTFAKQ